MHIQNQGAPSFRRNAYKRKARTNSDPEEGGLYEVGERQITATHDPRGAESVPPFKHCLWRVAACSGEYN